MSSLDDCAAFRARLEEARERAEDVGSLPHVRECAACAALLRREVALDRLLDRLPVDAPPAGLAHRVRAGLAPERGAGANGPDDLVLDEMLGALGAEAPPAGLSERVLEGLRSERFPAPTPARPAARRSVSRRPLALAAAALVALLSGWLWLRAGGEGPVDEPEAELAELEQDDELLLYAAERWDLLTDDDLDVWLASLDAEDALLIEFAEDTAWVDGPGGGR